MKIKNKKIFGFTLLELLVVIVIIGLVSTITLTVIYMSRNRAKKARIVSDLGQIRKTAELFYNNNNYSYANEELGTSLEDDPDISTLSTDISKQGGSLVVSAEADSYVAYSKYPGAESGHCWCVDDKGNSQDISYAPNGDCKTPSGQACDAVIVRPPQPICKNPPCKK
jgi:general secretion pathway protein G